MAGSEVVRSCFVDNLFRAITGQHSDSLSEPSLTALQQNFIADGDILTLVADMIISDVTLLRADRD